MSHEGFPPNAGDQNPITSLTNRLTKGVKKYFEEKANDREITWKSLTRELLSNSHFKGYDEPLNVNIILANIIQSPYGVKKEDSDIAEPMLDALAEIGALKIEEEENPNSPTGSVKKYYIRKDPDLGYEPALKLLQQVQKENKLPDQQSNVR